MLRLPQLILPDALRAPLRPAAPAAQPPWHGRLLLELLGRLQAGQLRLQLPSGEWRSYGAAAAGPAAELRLLDWRACERVLRGGDIGFGEALRRGWLESPDLVALMRLALRNEAALAAGFWGGPAARCLQRLRQGLRRNTRRGARANIHAHYDIGNDFYRLWLDDSWTYSAALFEGEAGRPLEAAQAAKYQRILDRLDLRPGQRVLEIGCGWGGFACHAARRGLHVHGVTISPAQLEVARARVAAAGLQAQVQLELRDYRDLRGHYDAVVSIEMFEAVGQAFWPRYFAQLRERLAPGGQALVQTITIGETRFARYARTSDFIRHYVFPGGMLPTPARFLAAAARAGLGVRDLLCFGADYALTLRHWRERFEQALPAVRALGLDETFVRTWRLYLAYCEAGFAEGRTDVVQFHLGRE
jgi:cyclopropane-fatty-acyl-phospholipid synthase